MCVLLNKIDRQMKKEVKRSECKVVMRKREDAT